MYRYGLPVVRYCCPILRHLPCSSPYYLRRAAVAVTVAAAVPLSYGPLSFVCRVI